MPEGDSVYRQCKMLREALEGAEVESSDFRVPALATSDVSGRPLQLHRATRATAWLWLILVIGWVLVLQAVNDDLTALNGGLDLPMRLLQLLLLVAIVGTAAAIWNAVSVAKAAGKHRLATVWAVAIALAAAFMVWLFLDLGLLTASLNY